MGIRHHLPAPGAMAILLIAVTLILLPTASAGASAIVGTVLDKATGDPIEGANVTVSFSGNGTVVAELRTDGEGRFRVDGLSNDVYTVHIEAGGYIDSTGEVLVDSGTYGGDEFTFTGSLSPVTGPGTPTPSSGITLPQFLIMGILVAATSLVLYSKIKRENLLRNAIRRRIFEHVEANPGAHYRGILKEMDLPMGVLSYHLNVLEKGEYLKSRQDGMYRRFFLVGRRTEVRFFLSDVQESIMTVIRDDQGISQSSIADRINVSRKVVNYHARILDQAGLIYMESQGREMACYTSERPVSSIP